MTNTFLVTGAGSGIGRATRMLLESRGDRVVGVDVSSNVEIQANLGTSDGLQQMVEEATRLCPEGLDGVVAAAGISAPYDTDRAPETIAVNYFGAVGTLEGLRPLLSQSPRPRAVAICSTSALLPVDETTLAACLSGDRAAAVTAIKDNPYLAYMTSKKALSLWVRRAAVTEEWGGSGILLNGVAPGVVKTPITAGLFDDPAMMDAMTQSNPIAVKGHAEPEEIAELIVFLATLESHYLTGQVIFMDGGTDAILRPDTF